MLAAAELLQRLTAHREKVVEQIRKRLAGAPVRDRLVSLFDPHARPLRTGTLGKPSEFGSLEQLAEATPHSKPGRRGCILPQTAAKLQRLRLAPREVALDGGVQTKASEQTLAALAPKRVFIAARKQPGSKRTQRRRARYRTGSEGRSSHVQRRHRLRRSRLNGAEGERTQTNWAVLAYTIETYRRYARADDQDSGKATQTNDKAKPNKQLPPPPHRHRLTASVYPGEVD